LKTLEEPPSYAIFILATTEKHKILPTILSRCQVFDFRRITVTDIAKHLSLIAQKEGIDAEAQALHTIAQKADGGLRDALSIFDQLVSYGGNSLTYANVLKNLNVVDHEHYFNMVTSLLNADPAGALVIFNDILFQGFDGHLFVSGLARHLRDLLVSQDPRTIPLLEVSEELGARYAEQARAIPRELLVQGLEPLSPVDARYKSSKEPRLLVELALIQLARHTAPAGSGGRSAPPVAALEKKNPDVTRAVPAAAAGAAPSPLARAGRELPAASLATEPQVTRPIRRLAGSVSISQHLAPAAPALSDHPGDQPKPNGS